MEDFLGVALVKNYRQPVSGDKRNRMTGFVSYAALNVRLSLW